MEADGKIEQYCILAKGSRGLALQDLIQRATAEPGIFAFGELLSVPAVQEASYLVHVTSAHAWSALLPVDAAWRGSVRLTLLLHGVTALRPRSGPPGALQLRHPRRVQRQEACSSPRVCEHCTTVCWQRCCLGAKTMEENSALNAAMSFAADPSRFPALSDAQQLKLKQLTVASIAAHTKVCCQPRNSL